MCALFVLAAMAAGCGFKIFEDVGSDPHPPTVEIVSLIRYVAPEVTEEPVTAPTTTTTTTTTAATLTTIGKTISWDSGGFTLSVGQKFLIGRAYADAGGDIVKFVLRDRDGPLNTELTPLDMTYYPGVSGSVLGPEGGIEFTGIFGRHRVNLWAEDSHGSRSEKVEFIITFTDR